MGTEDKESTDPSYRNLLIETEQRVSEQFDKTMLTIAGGSLAISLAFIKDVIGNGAMQAGWLLIISWASLTACLIIILVAFYFGLLAYRKAQDQVDDKTIKNETPGGYYSKILSICNAVGILLLCIGLITLFTFAYRNLPKEPINGTKTTCTSNAEANPATEANPTVTATPKSRTKTADRGFTCASTKTPKVSIEITPNN